MASEPLALFPTEILLGDSIRVRFEFPAYRPADGWALDVSLLGPTATSLSIEVEGSGAGPGWIATLTAASSADDLLPGHYSWTARVDQVDERITTAHGRLEVHPDPATATSGEARSIAQQLLDAIEAALLAYPGTTSFSVFGRTYTYPDPEALLRYRNSLRAEIAADEEAARQEQGLPSQRVAWVRF